MKYPIAFIFIAALSGCASTGIRQAPTLENNAAPISCASAPRFPIAAIKKNLEGWVVVDFSLNQSGYPIDMKVVDSSPEGYFENSAIESISSCRFKAAADVVPGERLNIVLDFRY